MDIGERPVNRKQDKCCKQCTVTIAGCSGHQSCGYAPEFDRLPRRINKLPTLATAGLQHMHAKYSQRVLDESAELCRLLWLKVEGTGTELAACLEW